MRALAAAAGVVALSAVATPAGAVEHEHQLGVDLGVPLLVTQSSSTSTAAGGSLGLHYSYGLTDAWNLVGDGGTSLMPLGVGSLVTGSQVDVGLAYVLDVLRWIPWGSAEVGGYVLTGGPGGTQVLPGVALTVGLDYRIDRSWAVGFMLREHLLVTDAATYPSFVQGLGRFTYTWGW